MQSVLRFRQARGGARRWHECFFVLTFIGFGVREHIRSHRNVGCVLLFVEVLVRSCASPRDRQALLAGLRSVVVTPLLIGYQA